MNRNDAIRSPFDPRVTQAIIKRIKEMSIEELDARLRHREEGVIETAYPDPSPVTREELLRRKALKAEESQQF